MAQRDDEAAPPPAAPEAARPLIGRESELLQLELGLDEAVAGRSRVFLIGGEAGIGKSRLADEIADIARGRGVRVLWGRCWEAGGAPPYWPWVQVLRTCLRDLDAADDDRRRGSGADIAPAVRELAELRAEPGTEPSDADSARFGQFDAISAFLIDVTRHRPLLLVLEDLQSSDAPSLLLLRFLAGQLADAPMMVIATFRSEDLVHQPLLTSSVADVTRLPIARRIELTGLDGPQVGRVVEAVTGVQPAPAVAAALFEETGGNPFFVSEIARLAAAEGRMEETDPTYWERAIPQGVRQVVRRRIDRLSREGARVLSLAAVLGREFALVPLSQISGLGLDDLEEILDEGVASGLLVEDLLMPGSRRFSHAVIRDTLYDELPPSHRARLHVQAGEALQARHEATDDTRMAEIAHHFFQAGPRGGIERIVGCARRAGDQSLALLAYEEAVRLYRMALTALGWAERPEPRTECDLRLAIADAWSRAGDLDETRSNFLLAAELAENLGDQRAFAQAALGYGGRFVWLRAAADPAMMPLLERALEALGDDERDLKVRVMARLAGAKRDEIDRAPRDALSAETVEVARESGDAGLLAYALVGRHAAMLGPSHVRSGLEAPDELLEVAERARNPELTFEGRMHQMMAFLERGDVASAERTVDQLEQIAAQLHQPTHQWFAVAARANLALLRGRMDDAATLIEEAARIGGRAQNWDAQGFAGIQRFILRREQGRLFEMREWVEASVGTYPTRPLFACMAAAMAVEVDEPARATAIVDDLARDSFAGVPFNNDWSLSMFLLAEVAHALGDAPRAERVYDALRPSGGRCVETVEASVGSSDRALGLLASTLGRYEDSVRHLEVALTMNARMGAQGWFAHTQVDLAAVLSARGEAVDAEQVRPLLESALAISQTLDLAALRRRAETELDRLGAPAHAGPRRSEPAATRRGVFLCEGDYWLVGMSGNEHRLHGTKGLGYIASLLGAPGQQVHVLDLVGEVGDEARRPGRLADVSLTAVASSSDDVLDGRARAAYRARIEALQAEIDEGEAWNDLERTARSREELDLIVQELSTATGLGGRSRTFTTAAERARINATRAIRTAISNIREHDDALASHLERSVRTGAFCSYEADRQAPVDWNL